MGQRENLPDSHEKPIQSETARLLGLLFGPSVKELGEHLSVEVQIFCVERVGKLRRKILDLLEEKKILPEDVRRLPVGIGTKLLREAAIEDEDEVLEMWARLVVSALAPEGPDLEKGFVGVLSGIGGLEVLILRFLWLRVQENDSEINSIQNAIVAAFANEHLQKYSVHRRAVAVQNLVRQECVRLQLDHYTMHKIHFDDRALVMSTGENLSDGTRGPARNSLSEIGGSFSAIKRLIADLSGARNKTYLGLSDGIENPEGWMPEVAYELTELGSELMKRCEPVLD